MELEREYPPVAVHKLKGHLMNLHMRDPPMQETCRRYLSFMREYIG